MAVFLSPGRAGQGGRAPLTVLRFRKRHSGRRRSEKQMQPTEPQSTPTCPCPFASVLFPYPLHLPILPASKHSHSARRTKTQSMGPKSANTLVSGWNRPRRHPIASFSLVPSRIRRFLSPEKRACTAHSLHLAAKNTAARLSRKFRPGHLQGSPACLRGLYHWDSP